MYLYEFNLSNSRPGQSISGRLPLIDDKNAYRTLFDLFYQPLCVYARRYVDEHEVIEDFVQNVLLCYGKIGKI